MFYCTCGIHCKSSYGVIKHLRRHRTDRCKKANFIFEGKTVEFEDIGEEDLEEAEASELERSGATGG